MRNIILCFRCKEYAQRLGTYLRKYYQKEFRVVWESGEYCKGSEDVLLTDDWEVYKKQEGEGTYFFDFEDKGEGISPYQSGDELACFILWELQKGRRKNVGKQGELIIFYTPGGSSSQQEAAFHKGELLAREYSCLYIPVRDNTGNEENEGIHYDLSELCYWLKKGEELTDEKILAAVEKEKGCHCLRGFHSMIHVAELEREISRVVSYLLENAIYEKVILDLQILPSDAEELFQNAKEIYGVNDSGRIDVARLYEDIGRLKDRFHLSENIYQIWKWGEDEVEESN